MKSGQNAAVRFLSVGEGGAPSLSQVRAVGQLQKREEKATADAASKTGIGWGRQIRSYVLQPYQMVKDLRTGQGRTVAVEDVE